MARRVLGVSWLGGRVRMIAPGGKSSQATWESPEPIHSPEELGAALATGLKTLPQKVTRAHLVLDHRQLLFSFQDVPPAKPSQLRELLGRIVQRGELSSEPSRWGFIPLPSSRGKHRVLVHLLPVPLVEGIERAFQSAGLDLENLVPVVEILRHQGGRLPAEREDCSVVVAEVEGSISFTVMRGTTEMLFFRAVPTTESAGTDRTNQEINRTVLFIQQQFGITVNRLWAAGSTQSPNLLGLKLRSGAEARFIEGFDNPFAPATEVAKLPASLSSNIVGAGKARTRSMRQLLTVTAGIAFVTAIATTAMAEARAYEDRRIRAGLTAEQRRNLAAQAHQEQCSTTAARLRTLVDALGTPADPDIPSALLRSIAAALPQSAKVTEFSMERLPDRWKVRIAGSTLDSRLRLVASLEHFEAALAKPPLQFKVTDGSRTRLFSPSATALFSSQPFTSQEGTPFVVEGEIQ